MAIIKIIDIYISINPNIETRQHKCKVSHVLYYLLTKVNDNLLTSLTVLQSTATCKTRSDCPTKIIGQCVAIIKIIDIYISINPNIETRQHKCKVSHVLYYLLTKVNDNLLTSLTVLQSTATCKTKSDCPTKIIGQCVAIIKIIDIYISINPNIETRQHKCKVSHVLNYLLTKVNDDL